MPPKLDAQARALIDELAAAKVEFARAFLTARTQGNEITPGRASSVEDARMWAKRALDAKKVRDPEIIRWELVAHLGAPKMESE